MWIIFIQSYPHWLLVYPLHFIQHIVPPINYEAHISQLPPLYESLSLHFATKERRTQNITV